MGDLTELRDLMQALAELGVLIDQETPANLQAEILWTRLEQDETSSRERDRRFWQMVEKDKSSF